MGEITLDYSAAGVPVRSDLKDSQRDVLARLARPGPWLTGAERMAVAAESRHGANCRLCLERKRSVSPEHPQGEHARVSELPEALVEVAHRVRHDPQRLGRSWFQRMLERGLSEGAYVEAVGVVTFTAGLDYFCRAIGIPEFPLPEPEPGAPSGHVPAGLEAGRAWVSLLAPENASGSEADLYAGVAFVPNIARALSQVPDHARLLQDESRSHYLDLADLQDPSARRELDRLQMELVAGRVSALNECFY